MSMLSVAATQMACSWDLPANLERAEKADSRGGLQGSAGNSYTGVIRDTLFLYRAGFRAFRTGDDTR